MMKSADIRRRFLDYFAGRGHAVVPSSSLVPGDDPTLLFTNSGMAQFKDVFLGFDKRPYKTACTAQRCLRAGGKHNDLENVGHTARHHTFFEMLGNFSFGDYFKEKAIPMAWEFLTSPAHLGLRREHLWVTVFGGGDLFGDGKAIPADDEAARLWLEVLIGAGFSPEEAKARIVRINNSDNFWMMGDTGPCGPCSEIFYDIDADAKTFRGADEQYADVCVEVWNLVFMQFNRGEGGDLAALPKPCVDTGMGLERISAVMQGVPSNYDTDSFVALLGFVADAVKDAGGAAKPVGASPRVIADHIRAAAYLVNDGVLPSNEGRGYVLRRIIRRALRHGWQLGARAAFFYKLAAPLPGIMMDNELGKKAGHIAEVLRREEDGFSRMLAAGMDLLKAETAKIPRGGKLPGAAAFKLFDTFGFPLDLTEDILRADGLTTDREGFDECMKAQRQRSRAVMKFKSGAAVPAFDGAASVFCGYEELRADAVVCALFVGGAAVDAAKDGDNAIVVLDRTPFYAESGGQIGDAGIIRKADDERCIAEVSDTQKIRADVWGHLAVVRGGLRVGDAVVGEVNARRRAGCSRNHSAAHLMHAALRRVLGNHVEQRGSLVGESHLRFDFSHDAAVTPAQLRDITMMINARVRGNAETVIEQLPYKEAIGRGAMALFGEKYGDIVRTVTMDADYSVELCGGTHVGRAGEIGYFCFTGESAIAAGVRRVEALCGEDAVRYAADQNAALLAAAAALKSPVDKLEDKARQLQESLKAAQKQTAQMRESQSAAQADKLAKNAEDGGGYRFVIAEVDADASSLRAMAVKLRADLAPAAVFLACANDGKASFAAATNNGTNAREWLAAATKDTGAKGGGKEDYAQAAGGDAKTIPAALKVARDFLHC